MIDSISYEYPDDYTFEKTIKYSTETTRATEFAKETTKGASVGGSWGWGSGEASISQTISNKTSESLTITQEESTTRKFNTHATEEKPKTLAAVFQRVVTFYIFDSEGNPVGVPVNEGGSSIFENYLPAREFTVKDDNHLFTKSWHFE